MFGLKPVTANEQVMVTGGHRQIGKFRIVPYVAHALSAYSHNRFHLFVFTPVPPRPSLLQPLISLILNRSLSLSPTFHIVPVPAFAQPLRASHHLSASPLQYHNARP